jgi:predicted nucleotidyltransferase
MIKFKTKKLDVKKGIKQLNEKMSRMRNIDAFYLFGSFANGRQTPLSDLDLAYLPRANLNRSQAAQLDKELYLTLAKLFETDDITLVNLNEAPPALAFNVIKNNPIFCKNNSNLSAYKESIISVYPEIKRMNELFSAIYLKRLRKKYEN